MAADRHRLSAIIWGLEEWFRKSELSCDRAGLLAGQDVDASRRALMKLAGGAQLSELNPDAFREQAHEYDAVPDLRDSVLKILQLQGNTHPFAVVRFAELDYWATHGEYERILGGDYPRRDNDGSASVGDEVRNAAKAYQDSWNRSQDPLIGIFRGVAGTAARAGGGLFDRLLEPRPGRRRQAATATRTTSGQPGVVQPGSVFRAAGCVHLGRAGPPLRLSGAQLLPATAQMRTRSSRCTTSRSYSWPSLLASHRVERPIRPGISVGVVVHQAARDDRAVLVAQVHRVAGVERALDAGDAGRQQAGAPGHHGLHRAVVQPQAAAGHGRVLEPEQPGRRAAAAGGGEVGAGRLAAERGRGAGRVGDHGGDARRRGDHRRLDLGGHAADALASWPALAPPWPALSPRPSLIPARSARSRTSAIR